MSTPFKRDGQYLPIFFLPGVICFVDIAGYLANLGSGPSILNDLSTS